MTETDLFKQLNIKQAEAASQLEGAVLVLAGAGSGKTRVVTFRIVHLIQSGVHPKSILGLTFTNKAASEMKTRVQKLTQNEVLISTFHSLGARILREFIHHLGYSSHFTIYDEDDADKILKTCLVDLGIKDKKGWSKECKGLISDAKNRLLRPDQVTVSKHPTEVEELFPKVYASYQNKLKGSNAVDFDDLLFLTVQLFQEHPEVLERCQHRWRYLLVDEYQDTNHAQYMMLKFLVQESGNIFVVGDPDQSIYSWRGANIHNILNFEKDYPGASIIRLEQNYRSTTTILNAANEVISHNEQRYEKVLWSDLGEGDKIGRFTAYDEKEEAYFIASRARSLHEKRNIPYSDIVVFYRTNAQSRPLEDQFLSMRIPYVIVGGISFYQRREIKDILAFLRVLHSGSDLVSFVRTIHIPKRGIGDATLDKLRRGAEEENLSIIAYIEALVAKQPLKSPISLSAKIMAELDSYVQMIKQLQQDMQTVSLKDLVIQVIERTGYLNYLKLEDKESFEERKENLDELIAKAMEWELASASSSLSSFLEELALKSSLDETDFLQDRVNLMTIHNSKGLEFEIVFIAGLEEGLLPHINARDNPAAVEEERRLFYVGMTRAKSSLFVTHTLVRYIWGTEREQYQSRFLREIPPDYLERVKLTYTSR